MREFQERRRVKKLLHSRYVIAALALVCLLMLHAVWGAYQKYEKSKEIADRMNADLQSLQAREASLQSQISALRTPEGEERVLRDRFGVVKPGEQMVVVVDDASGSAETTQTSPGFWSRLLGFFGF